MWRTSKSMRLFPEITKSPHHFIQLENANVVTSETGFLEARKSLTLGPEFEVIGVISFEIGEEGKLFRTGDSKLCRTATRTNFSHL